MYIGSTVNLRRRFITHRCLLNTKKHVNRKLQAAWNKHGEENFELFVLEPVDNKEHLIMREQHWINWFGAVENGYNLRQIADSQLGCVTSEATKKKLSLAMKDRYFSPEHRERISISKKGIPRDAETRKKLSLANTGKKHPKEVKAKIAAANRGKKRSAEFCRKVSERTLGRKSSDETKEKIRQFWVKRRFIKNSIDIFTRTVS